MKTKTIDGKEYGARSFAYVGDPEDPSTWDLLIADAGHVRDALARFDQTNLPADAKAKVARKVVAAAKRFGIDATNFASEYVSKQAQALLKTSQADMSYEELAQALCQALVDQFGCDSGGYPRFRLCETFPDYVIAQGPDGDLYQIPYTSGGDGDDDISFGEPQQVETAYVPVQESVRFLAAESATEDGLTWPIQVMQAGFAHGHLDGIDPRLAGLPHYFPREVVAQVAEACKSMRFGRRHALTPEEEVDPARIAGLISNGRMSGNAAMATLRLFPTETEIKTKLTVAREAGQLDLFGASIFALFPFAKGKAEGKDALVAQRLGRLISVDLVTEAGAGGKILSYAASRSVLAEVAAQQKGAARPKARPAAATTISPGTIQGGQTNGGAQGAGRISGGTSMKESIVKVLEALRSIDAGSASELQTEFDALPEGKQAEFFAKVSQAVAQKLPAALATNGAAAQTAADLLTDATRTVLEGHNQQVLAKANEALANAKRIQFGNMLEQKLAASKLPVPAAMLAREHFQDRNGNLVPVDGAAVDAYIVKVRQSFASYADVGRVGTSGVEVGLDQQDKIQLAMDQMLGVKEALKNKSVRAFRGIREAYTTCTGDRDCTFGSGGFYKVSEAIATTDFPNLLLSSLTKKLIQDYEEYQIVVGLEKLYVATTLGDYKTQDRVRMGYLSDLPTVAEAGPYTELTKPTDEKISYTIAKRGGLLTISEETIRNDDLGKIAAFPGRLARASRHTLATFVSNFFITPPNYDPDGLAWFVAGHSNLGSTALASAELDARAIALAKQAEKDSGNRLGLTLDWIMIPIDLRPTAMQINRNMTGTNNWYQKFGANEENIVVNPLLTDVTDWYGGSYSAPFLEIGFLDGYQTPQIFIANLPTQGTQFTNDQLQYKVKFVFGGKPIDFRGVFKEVVAG